MQPGKQFTGVLILLGYRIINMWLCVCVYLLYTVCLAPLDYAAPCVVPALYYRTVMPHTDIMNTCIGIQYSIWPGILDYVSSLVGEIKHYADHPGVSYWGTELELKLTLWKPRAQLCARGEIRFLTEWEFSIPAYIWDLFTGIYIIRYVLPWF